MSDPTMSRPAAFFDFDRTLISVNSATLWVKAEREAGRVSSWQLFKAAAFMVQYHLSMIDMERAMNSALSTIAGQPESDLAERTRVWYRDQVRQHLLPAAVESIESHRREGHAVILLTSSSPYLSAAVQEDLNLDAVGCTSYEITEDGCITGRVKLPMCYGKGKIDHAVRLASIHDLDVDHSYFYTDSYTDRPLLERVEHPRVVNPDPRLRRLARKRGWQILDWQPTGGRQTP